MSDHANLLEALQADVFAVLQSTPTLAMANIQADNAGDIESRVKRALGTLTGGRKGLVIVVLRAEVEKAEENLPGPPMRLRIEVQTIEQVLINRDSEKGTTLRSSQAALNVLAALHLRSLGGRLLVAAPNPVKPLEVKEGFVSDSVSLICQVAGFVAPRAAAVTAELVAGELVLTCSTTGSQIRYTANGVFPCPDQGILYAGPLADLAPGTILRIAAYAPDMGPSDVLEVTVNAA